MKYSTCSYCIVVGMSDWSFGTLSLKLVALHGEEDKWRLFAVTPCEILNRVVISSGKKRRLQLDVAISMLETRGRSWWWSDHTVIETSSCNLQFFSELITAQVKILHGVTANSLYLTFQLFSKFIFPAYHCLYSYIFQKLSLQFIILSL